MPQRRTFRIVLGSVLITTVMACGGGGQAASPVTVPGTTDPTTTGKAGLGDPSLCPIGALANATDPVDITVWSSETGVNLDAVTALVDEYNATQTDVHVDLVAQGAESDLAFLAALRSDRLPDLLQTDGISFLQQAIDSQSIVPAGACLAADHADTSDFLPRSLTAYTVDGQLWAMPFVQNAIVLYYNRSAFQAAGLDPDKPPATIEEMRADSLAIMASGYTPHGVAWMSTNGTLSALLSTSAHPMVDHDNGRTGRATHMTIDDEVGTKAFTLLRDMSVDGTALSKADDRNALLALANKDVAMVLGANSAELGEILKASNEQSFPGVEPGIGPMVSIDAEHRGGNNFRGNPLYLVKGQDPAKVEAAYRFALWLTEPEQQAMLDIKTGSVPVRSSTIELPELKDFWQQNPLFRVAYDDLASASAPPGGGAAVLGPAGEFSKFVTAGWTSVTTGTDPATAVSTTVQQVDQAFADYAEQVGAG
jgi:sn-glycerol 3-phosphate transport system substrate-binding protein